VTGRPAHTDPCAEYLQALGVPELPPKTLAFDPGYDVQTVKAHLEQSGHLISCLKLSMACWQVASQASTKAKIEAASSLGVKVCTGGGPFEVAVACNRLEAYLDLCVSMGFKRIEAGEGFIDLKLSPKEVVDLADQRGLEVHFEIGEKHSGAFTPPVVQQLIEQGREWLDAGAKQLVVEGRENAENVGLFDGQGNLDLKSADAIVEAFGLGTIVFEAPNKASQFAFIRHFGPTVELCNVRLEELLRIEIYRRGLHSDAFMYENLRPTGAEIKNSDIK